MRRPGVMHVSHSGNTPRSTIDLRLYIGNDTPGDVMDAVDAALAEFRRQVSEKLAEVGKT